MRKSNAEVFWPVLVVVLAVDVATKALAVRRLVPQRFRHDIFADKVSFTLVYNSGAAFGLHLGQYSRWIFTVLTVVALVILGRLYYSTRPGQWLRTASLALVCGGAIGNLLDRLFTPLGVVDFIDVGIGDARWPTFNVADVAVSVGAFLLALVLWEEDRVHAPLGATPPAPVAGESSEVT